MSEATSSAISMPDKTTINQISKISPKKGDIIILKSENFPDQKFLNAILEIANSNGVTGVSVVCINKDSDLSLIRDSDLYHAGLQRIHPNTLNSIN